MSIPFLLDEKLIVVPVGSGGERLGGREMFLMPCVGKAVFGSSDRLESIRLDEPAHAAAMIFKAPPQFGHRSMSMSKTRLSSRAQLMRAGRMNQGSATPPLINESRRILTRTP
jgi:hypothetical protein